MSIKHIIYTLLLLIVIFAVSCKKMIEVDNPRTLLLKSTVFDNDQTAISAVAALYIDLSSRSGGFSCIHYCAGLSADELIVEQGFDQVQFYENEIGSVNPNLLSIWQSSYKSIYQSNAIIEGLNNSVNVADHIKNQLIGEALFFRAFNYFYLVNLFGNVPYTVSTDYRINGLLTAMPADGVNNNIISDLIEAKSKLSVDYSYSQNEKVRVNAWVAAALLARVYLYNNDWIHAEQYASEIINKTSLFTLNTDLSQVFLKNSKETLLQLIPPVPQKFTPESAIFNRNDYSPAVATITDELFSSFEPSDARFINWIGTRTSGGTTWHYPLKYKETSATATGAEYSTIFRLAEQYLIRAEARAKQNNLTGANSSESDINAIRNRAGLSNTSASSQDELLAAIEQERKLELFTEWGHRWLDLKRTKRVIDVLSNLKTNWNNTDTLYPIPLSELQLNPNLQQNSGY